MYAIVQSTEMVKGTNQWFTLIDYTRCSQADSNILSPVTLF